jgi:hypothetical protein
MTTHHGKGGIVEVGANAVAEVTEWSVEESVAVAEDHAMGDAAMSHKAGSPGWSGSLKCWWDPSDTNGQVALAIGASVTLNLYPDGDAVSDTYLTGTATITNKRITSSRDNIVGAELQFTGNGALDPDAVVSA